MVRELIGQGADLIVGVGGDGTLNEIANGVAGTRVPLAILPGGTANVLSNELGLGNQALRAAARFGSLRAVRIGVGELANSTGRRRFVAMAGAGVDAEIVRRVNPILKKRVGKVAYWAAGLSALLETLPEFQVTEQGQPGRRGSFFLASRVRNYGGDLEIARTIRLTSGRLETVLFEGSFAPRYLKYLAGVGLGIHHRLRGVHTGFTNRADLSAETAIPVHVDGETAGCLPARIEYHADALTLLMPPEYPGAAEGTAAWTT